MPESTIQVATSVWDAAKWLLAGAAALLGYNIKTTKRQVEELKESSVQRDEYNGTVNSLRTQIDTNHKDLNKKIDSKFDSMQTTIIGMLKDK